MIGVFFAGQLQSVLNTVGASVLLSALAATGPPGTTVRVDPFGLVERSAVGADSAPLLVVPRVQPLGETSGSISDCTADQAHVVCRGVDGLQIWAYRA